MKVLLIFWCLLIGPAARAQSIRHLEDSLQHIGYGDTLTKAAVVQALLARDHYNERAIRGLTEVYEEYPFQRSRYVQDSLRAFFRRLIARDPGNPVAYVLQAQYGPGSKDSLLQLALALDSNFVPANALLAASYYHTFHLGYQVLLFGLGLEFEQKAMLAKYQRYRRARLLGLDPDPEEKRFMKRYRAEFGDHDREQAQLRSEAVIYAPKALTHLMRLWRTDSTRRPALQPQLMQVAGFLHDTALMAAIGAYREVIRTDSAGTPVDSPWRYFTLQRLMDTVGGLTYIRPYLANYQRAADGARFKQQWYSKPLGWYGEPLLDGVVRNDSAYRFTWIGSFHYPAVFRLEEKNGTGVLYWKAVVAKKRWPSKKLRGSFAIDHRQLSAAELQGFHRLLDSLQFRELATSQEVMGIDGARWILEANEHGRYHMVHRWNGSGLRLVCRYLIGLAPEAVRRNEFY